MARKLLISLAFSALAGHAVAQTPPPTPGQAPARTRTAPQPAPGQAQPQLPPLPAHLRTAQTPKTPPPGWALASVSGGRLYLRSVLPFAKEGAAAPAGSAPGAAGVELASVAEPFDVAQVQARTAGGEAIRPDALPGRLARETPVMVGFTSLPPDPTYLRILKDDTLVVLIPPPPEEPADHQQPPAAGAPARTPNPPAAPGAGAPAPAPPQPRPR